MRELFEKLRSLQQKERTTEEEIQSVLAEIVANEGHGPFTFDGKNFTIARSRAGLWQVRDFTRAEPKVIE